MQSTVNDPEVNAVKDPGQQSNPALNSINGCGLYSKKLHQYAELLANDKSDSFLLKGLEKSINQSDLESCESLGNKSDNDSDLEKSIRRIYSFNTSYSVTRMRETDEMHVLEKHKGAIAWKMSDIKGISPSLCTHKILMEDDFKPFIQSQRHLNPKVQDVVKNEIVKLLDSGLIYLISDNSIEFLLDEKKSTLVVELGKVLLGYKAKAVEIHKSTMNSIPLYRDVEPRLISWVLLLQSFDIEIKDKKGAKNLAADHLSRLENPDLGAFTKEEIADEFPDEHLMILKAELNDDAPLCLNNVMRRCVAGNEILEILAHCHSGPTRGHHSASITGRKIYESGFFWPSIYKGQTSCFMELNVLMELRDGAYEKTRIYKERTKKWHNSRLRGDKDFRVGDKVLLFNRDLDAIREKLKSKWYGPNVVKIVYPYGTVEITNKNGISFKVNGQRLKKYYDRHIDTDDKEVVKFKENTT
ncbi:hypothetical protein Tco_0940143 [Tanacetum coccineum]|uniref:Reverse transcriptase domain-containing protein n=1 Tax=Tanacetum coccineum TaxID=301880 RepID=A0ABQ5DNV2_9ASTR